MLCGRGTRALELALLPVLLAGCGDTTSSDPAAAGGAAGEGRVEGTVDFPATLIPTPMATAEPSQGVQPDRSAPAFVDPRTALADPLLLIEPGLLAGLVSALTDGLIVRVLDPAGPRLDESLTFLERLCRQGDTPAFVCRDRFGR